MTSPEALQDKLAATPLFNNFERETVHDFAQTHNLARYRHGQDLFAAGDAAPCFFYVVQGWIKLYRINREGQESIINIIAPGETFAEVAVFGRLGKYPVNAQAVDDVQVLRLYRVDFERKIAEDSTFALRILGSIAARQRHLVQQIEQVTIHSAPQRIASFLLHLSRFDMEKHDNTPVTVTLPYDKSLISNRLAIKPETFSRAFSKLKQYGVEACKHDVILNDPETLAEFCDYDPADRLF